VTVAAPGDGLGRRLEQYLSSLWSDDVRVANLSRIPGGASRETYRFDAETKGGVRGLILRRDPVGSLIDTDRRVEFLAYQSFFGRVPVPEPLALEKEGGPLQRPFFIMERIDGGTPASPFGPSPYGEHAGAIGEALFSFLGQIARADPATLPLAQSFALPAPSACWSNALDEWEAIILRDERHPQPIVRAAMRRLRRNPPPPASRISVVHGDYRSGNFLHDGMGKIIAVLDWEMVHFGDPLEDIAWCCDPLWNHFDLSRVAGTISEAQAIAIWERESGLKVDPQALKWWKLFSAVKGQAIWTTAARKFTVDNANLALAISGYYPPRRHDRIMADALERLVEEGWR
jgi:aminoglycoside phosphotransferase (APT) family kinase protein